MTSYCIHGHGRFMLLLNIIRNNKTFTTLKSKHDESNNQALLKRLKNLSVIGANKKLPLVGVEEPKDGQSDFSPPRRLTMEKLNRMICHYQTDPLTWNPYVLGRIFNIPEECCNLLAIYVRPMITYNKSTGEGNKKLINTHYVVDVARLKSDDNYLVTYKKIVFPESKQRLPKRALPEIDPDDGS